MSHLKDTDAIMAALNIFNDKENGNAHFLNGIETAKEIIRDAPTIEAEPVRHGHIEIKAISPWDGEDCYCSECEHGSLLPDYKWCPYCGARMENEVE